MEVDQFENFCATVFVVEFLLRVRAFGIICCGSVLPSGDLHVDVPPLVLLGSSLQSLNADFPSLLATSIPPLPLARLLLQKVKGSSPDASPSPSPDRRSDSG